MLEKEATFADDVVSRVWQEDVGDNLSGNVVCDTRGLTSCRVRREAGCRLRCVIMSSAAWCIVKTLSAI